MSAHPPEVEKRDDENRLLVCQKAAGYYTRRVQTGAKSATE